MSGRYNPTKKVKKGEAQKATEELLALAEQDSKPEEAQRAKIKAEYLSPEGKPEEATTANAMSLREHILSMSLFPNVYNSKYLNKHY